MLLFRGQPTQVNYIKNTLKLIFNSAVQFTSKT